METAPVRRQSEYWLAKRDGHELDGFLEERTKFDSDGLTDVDFDVDVVDSVEEPELVWKLALGGETLGAEREVSLAMAVQLDEEDEDEDEDPFAEEEEGEGEGERSFGVESAGSGGGGEYADVFEDEYDTPVRKGESRKASSARTFSTMPEEDSIIHGNPYESSAGARSDSSVLRTPVSQRARRNLPNGRFLSSPAQPDSSTRYYSPANNRYTSSPLAQRHQPSGFRNASSIRAMQMSSPSPPLGSSPHFAQSPRSARHRRLEREESYRSQSGTPSQHPNPKKEYPLILLHCSFTAMIPQHPPSVLAKALPSWIQENLKLLHDKVNSTVVERGILIPHPGEDYELLEERILESLELKRPRVGKCGHFLGARTPPEDEDMLKREGDDEHHHQFRDEKCTTCTSSVASTHNGTAGDTPSRRFDIKVFAANGLMRAGAWTAAWREMEKVDIEIGVWIPEEVRAALDREGQSMAQDHASMFEREADDVEQTTSKGARRDFTYPPAPSPPPASTLRQRPRSDTLGSSGPASTAACSKPAAASRPASRRSREQPSSGLRVKAPLSELLANYVKRKVHPTRNLLLQVVVVILAVVLLRQQFAGRSASATFPDSALLATANVAEEAKRVLNDPRVKYIDEPAGMVSEAGVASPTATVTETLTPQAVAMAACTFAPDQAGAVGMTALPSAVAKSVLDAVSAAISVVPSETERRTVETAIPIEGEAEAVKPMDHVETAEDGANSPVHFEEGQIGGEGLEGVLMPED